MARTGHGSSEPTEKSNGIDARTLDDVNGSCDVPELKIGIRLNEDDPLGTCFEDIGESLPEVLQIRGFRVDCDAERPIDLEDDCAIGTCYSWLVGRGIWNNCS